MKDNTIYISIIICSFNRADYIIDAVESMRNQTLPAGEFEVLVVDNNSTDNTGDLVRKYIKKNPEFQLHYLEEKEQGASFARNTGARKAKGTLLCFMDDDACAEPSYLEVIKKFFLQHPGATALGGRIIPRYIPTEPKWMSHYVSSMVGNFNYSKQVKEFKKGRYPLESNMVVRKEDFLLIGGFNTMLPGVKGTLRIGGEGKEFFLRLQATGKKIYYHPDAVVHHVVEVKKLTPAYLYRVASGYGRGEKVRTLAINKWAYTKKIVEYIYKLGGAVAIGLSYAVKGSPAKTLPLIRFRIDALKGLLEKSQKTL